MGKILSTKYEILSNVKTQNPNDQNGFEFRVFEIWYCLGFRASNLGFPKTRRGHEYRYFN
jgi:hypothetical protein